MSETEHGPEVVEKPVPRSVLRAYIAVILVIAAVLGVQGYYDVQTRHLTVQTRELARKTNALARENAARVKAERKTTLAVCLLRRNLARRAENEGARVKATAKFLRNGGKIPGISTKLIEEGLARDRKALRSTHESVHALGFAHCGPVLKRYDIEQKMKKRPLPAATVKP